MFFSLAVGFYLRFYFSSVLRDRERVGCRVGGLAAAYFLYFMLTVIGLMSEIHKFCISEGMLVI